MLIKQYSSRIFAYLTAMIILLFYQNKEAAEIIEGKCFKDNK